MNVSGISAMSNNQTISSLTESQSAQDNNSSSGWKYITVREDGIVYTYVVIGKNMKVLIGTSKDTDNTESKDKKNAKTAASEKDSIDNTRQKKLQTQTAGAKITAGPKDFFADFRMFGLTGYYQEKMRETVKNMENHIVCDNINPAAKTLKIKDRCYPE